MCGGAYVGAEVPMLVPGVAGCGVVVEYGRGRGVSGRERGYVGGRCLVRERFVVVERWRHRGAGW